MSIIDQMHEIAEERGGECLSFNCKSNSEKLRFECIKGHVWEAVPYNIKSGTWCPVCAGIYKKTIKEMHQRVNARGGKCLSTEYINSKTKILLECEKGHQWEATPNAIKKKTWCPHCARKVKRTIEEMHQIAKDRGGRCLSDTYNDGHTKLLWECSEGHQWEAASVRVRLQGSWCSTCAGIAKKLSRSRGNQTK